MERSEPPTTRTALDWSPRPTPNHERTSPTNKSENSYTDAKNPQSLDKLAIGHLHNLVNNHPLEHSLHSREGARESAYLRQVE